MVIYNLKKYMIAYGEVKFSFFNPFHWKTGGIFNVLLIWLMLGKQSGMIQHTISLIKD